MRRILLAVLAVMATSAQAITVVAARPVVVARPAPVAAKPAVAAKATVAPHVTETTPPKPATIVPIVTPVRATPSCSNERKAKKEC